MSFLHRHKLPVPGPTLPGTRQTAPAAASTPTAPAAGAHLQSSTSAPGRATDATREASLDPSRVTAGGVTAPSAGIFTLDIRGRDAAAYAHHAAPTLMEAQHALRDALDRGDRVRAHGYAKYTDAVTHRAQASAADELYGGAA